MTKHRTILSFILAGVCIGIAACASPPPETETPAAQTPPAESSAPELVPEPPDDGTYVSLFNGRDLTGWRRHDTIPEDNVGGKWEVVDGVLEGDQDPPGRGGLFITENQYRDFIFKFETLLDFPTDSGIFLRVGDDGKSYQVTLDNREDGDIGAIYLPWTQGMVQENPQGETFFNQEDWNEGTVQIQGQPPRIRFWLNGRLVTDLQLTDEQAAGVPAEGYLALQVHPGENWQEGNKVRFRNLRIKELQ